MSLTDQWLDIKANIEIIKAYIGYDELYYVGYSGATTQMLYALATEEPFLAERVKKVVLLAPCTVYG